MLPKELASILPPSSFLVSTNASNEQSFIEILRTRNSIYKPGTTPIYSNAAFSLLALALEKITGKPFLTTMQDSIFSPLNMSVTTLGTPFTDDNTVIPADVVSSGWQIDRAQPALLADTGMFSTVTEMSIIGQSILRSTLLTLPSTGRWLKPHSYTSNPRNGVGMPFDIYTPTLSGTTTGPIIEIFTKLGAHGLYSPYFGLVPDHGVGFVILSADTNQAADLNAYADLIAEYLIPAMERTAAAEATMNYAGNYTSGQGVSSMTIDVDGLSGLSVLNWTANGGDVDVKGAYAQLLAIPAETMDMRLYPTDLHNAKSNRTNLTFRAVFQDTAAPADAGTPTCTTWRDGVDELVYNGFALDEFVFTLDKQGGAVTVTIDALGMTMERE